MEAGNGRFCWYELMTTDMAAAERFYRAVVGWNARAAGHEGMPYTQLLAGETPAAGLMTLPHEASAGGALPGWIGYVAVDDVDGFVGRVTAAGGRVHRAPAEIPGVGRFAVVADPQGVAFALFRPADAEAAPSLGSVAGSVGWRELTTDDAARAYDFYSGLFGWTKAGEVEMGSMGTYQMFATGGGMVGGMMNRPPGVPSNFWTYYIQVDGVGEAVGRLKQAGGSVIDGPHQVPGDAWIVRALDPQGAMFALTSARA